MKTYTPTDWTMEAGEEMIRQLYANDDNDFEFFLVKNDHNDNYQIQVKYADNIYIRTL